MEMISVVYNTPQSPGLQALKKSTRRATYRGDDLRGVQHTRIWSLPCATHRKVDLSGVQHTAETNCTLRSQNGNIHLSVVAFKQTIRRNPYWGEHIYHKRKDLKYEMLGYWEIFLTLWCAAHRVDNFVIKNLSTTLWSKISAKSKLNLKILQPVYQGLKSWKNGGQKYRDTLPLS